MEIKFHYIWNTKTSFACMKFQIKLNNEQIYYLKT